MDVVLVEEGVTITAPHKAPAIMAWTIAVRIAATR